MGWDNSFNVLNMYFDIKPTLNSLGVPLEGLNRFKYVIGLNSKA